MKMGYGNRLLLGQGGLAYRQPDYNDRLARTGWAWGCTPWDFDNDGDRDLYVANGFLRNQLGITVRNIGGMIFITIKNVLKRSCRWCSLNASQVLGAKSLGMGTSIMCC